MRWTPDQKARTPLTARTTGGRRLPTGARSRCLTPGVLRVWHAAGRTSNGNVAGERWSLGMSRRESQARGMSSCDGRVRGNRIACSATRVDSVSPIGEMRAPSLRRGPSVRMTVQASVSLGQSHLARVGRGGTQRHRTIPRSMRAARTKGGVCVRLVSERRGCQSKSPDSGQMQYPPTQTACRPGTLVIIPG